MLVIRYLFLAVAILALSAVLLVYNLRSQMDAMSVQNGNWQTNVNTGSADAGVMLRAAVALGGLLASTRENSVYYIVETIDGEPLRLDCEYVIRGGEYDADWWSITAYGWDNYLIPNNDNRYSYNNENLSRDADGRWEIRVSVAEQSGDWLPVGPAGAAAWRKISAKDFDLLLRLYAPGKDYLDNPASAPLPEIRKEGCA